MGALFAYIFSPVYKLVKEKIKYETLSALLVCTFVVLLFIIPGFFLAKLFVQESYVLYITAKQKLAIGIFEGCTSDFCNSVHGFLNDSEVNYYLQNMLKLVVNSITEKGTDFIVNMPRLFVNIFVSFFTMYYFLRGGEKFAHNLNRYLSLHKKNYIHILDRLKDIVRGIVFGYLIVALIQGFLGALVFWLFGVSSPLFWGVVMALLALIPFLGTGFVWVPASLIMFFNGMVQNSNALMFKAVGLFFFCLVFVSTLDNIIRPKLIGKKTKIHPVVVMMGIFGGLILFGTIGVIVGPLILSVMMVFIEVFFIEKIKKV